MGVTDTMASSSLLEAALHYARRGWPVFPCDPATKRPLLARDRDERGAPIKGSGGVSKATTDEEQIWAWWRKWPRAMIGISVGRGDVVVVDFDPRTDDSTGEEWTLDRLKGELEAMMGCALPPSLTARTPSGGVHVYFRMPPGDPIGNRGNLPHHVDVRGLGGYVIAPPSLYTGNDVPVAYRWLRGNASAEIAEMPAALVEILRSSPARGGDDAPTRPAGLFTADVDEAQRRYAMNALDREAAELAATPKGGGRHGGRNQGAYHAAFNMGQLVGAGALSETLARSVLLEVVRGFDPKAFEQHKGAIENGLSNGIAKPRDLGAVGARTARGRDSDRSASSSSDRPFAPPQAFHDDADPAPREGDFSGPFHDGTASIASGGGGEGERIRPTRDAVLDRMCAFFPTTDLGNAERFRARHGGAFRFCPELGWFAWDGRRWKLLSEEKDRVPGEVSLAVFDTVRAIGNEADLIAASGCQEDDPEDSERLDRIVGWRGSGDNKTPILFSDMLRAHAKSSEGAQRIGCIAGLVKSFADVAIRADAMDSDRMAINLLNGTLRLVRTGSRWSMVDGKLSMIAHGDAWGVRLFVHDRKDLISKVANVAFDPIAKSDAYDRFLAAVQPDVATRRFLHQWGGLSLTGDISEQKLAFFHGKGRNGKSTLVDAWSWLAGDYGGSVAIETFLDQGRGRKGGEATPDLARLPGIRFLRTSEPEKGAKLAEALIKLITGGELIDARHLNKGFFSFLPSFKVTISGNHKPKITGHDDGIWRRVMLVPWDVQIAKDDVDKSLPEKLRGEAAGILNRLIAGLLDWRDAGLIEPDSVLEATAKYREQSDQLGRFLSEATRDVTGARSKSSLLFALFSAWSKATGGAEWQPVGFAKAMEDRGYEKKTSNGVQWLDIEMVKTVDDYAEAAGDDGGGSWDENELPP